jgi:hypothetical protein
MSDEQKKAEAGDLLDWIIAEIKAGRTVIVPVKLHGAIICALQYNEIDPALHKQVVARDITQSDLKQ